LTGEIYIIKNYINDKVYIGQTIQGSETRFLQHLKLLKSSARQAIHKAIKRHGKENFYYEVLESNIEFSKLDEREIYWIALYKSDTHGYNLMKGGNQSRKPINVQLLENLPTIIEIYQSEDISLRQIAKRFDTDHKTLSKMLRANGIPIAKRNKSNKNITFDDIELIKNLFAKGVSAQEIAHKINRNIKTVQRYIKSHCI
jgi:group I intron endonuclease